MTMPALAGVQIMAEQVPVTAQVTPHIVGPMKRATFQQEKPEPIAEALAEFGHLQIGHIPKLRFSAGRTKLGLMKTVIEISFDHYDRFMERCDPACRESEILKRGPKVRPPNGSHYERIVEIHCEMPEAKILLDAARRVYPVVVSAIGKSISL